MIIYLQHDEKVTLPKAYVHAIGVQAGDALTCSLDNGAIRLTPQKKRTYW